MQIEITALKKIPLFATLADDELKRIATLSLVRTYIKGDAILFEGDMGGALYYLQSGLVKIFKISGEGREQILRLITAGYTFNDVPALDGGPNPASAAALEESRVYVLNHTELRTLIQTRPAVADVVVQTLASRLRHLVALAEDLSLRHVIGRIAKILLEQHDAVTTSKVKYRLTQQDIAALAGTAREVVGRALKRIEMSGAIEIHQGHVKILKRDLLAMIANGMSDLKNDASSIQE